MLCTDCKNIKDKIREVRSLRDLIGEIKLFDEDRAVGGAVGGAAIEEESDGESEEECRNCSVAKSRHTGVGPCEYK